MLVAGQERHRGYWPVLVGSRVSAAEGAGAVWMPAVDGEQRIDAVSPGRPVAGRGVQLLQVYDFSSATSPSPFLSSLVAKLLRQVA